MNPSRNSLIIEPKTFEKFHPGTCKGFRNTESGKTKSWRKKKNCSFQCTLLRKSAQGVRSTVKEKGLWGIVGFLVNPFLPANNPFQLNIPSPSFSPKSFLTELRLPGQTSSHCVIHLDPPLHEKLPNSTGASRIRGFPGLEGS